MMMPIRMAACSPVSGAAVLFEDPAMLPRGSDEQIAELPILAAVGNLPAVQSSACSEAPPVSGPRLFQTATRFH